MLHFIFRVGFYLSHVDNTIICTYLPSHYIPQLLKPFLITSVYLPRRQFPLPLTLNLQSRAVIFCLKLRQPDETQYLLMDRIVP